MAGTTRGALSELLFFVCTSSCTAVETQARDMVSDLDVSPKFQFASTALSTLSFSHTLEQRDRCTQENFNQFPSARTRQ